ncbi:GCN5-related N-acetyltransferase [Halorubrum aidingense JCM 13560]|uniref:GCN5-related N-acetyltransferase n=1 Tax=Halorubrum aidingense JCM 13560 TaxID=1230454 RepID=M0PC99_9EURY|nr:GNAT family N-acetyltransferase [Halorubrum aidingense]EMA67787.1 GCN5-related N-acetyltransferase [Halorubrum aidingense JCM 13560]
MSDRESGGADAEPTPAVVVREARPADADAVAAFTRDTWGERHDDYIPRVFPEWAASDDPDRETFVATLPSEAVTDSDAVTERDDREPGDTLVEGDGAGAAAPGDQEAVVGCIQGVLLSEWESWGQGIRVDPAARGFGVGTALSEAALEWARGRGATVCRNMVFSWNVMGLGQSRAVGFEPGTEFRFAEPAPDAGAVPDAGEADATDSADAAGDTASDGFQAVDDPDPNAAWAFWTDSDARDHLRGLALDPGESWACSALTRDRLRTAADEGRLLAVAEAPATPGAGRGPIAGFAVRTRTSERPAADGGDDDCDSASDGDADTERVAEYGVSAWRDVDAAGALYQSIAADAAEAGADATRVLIPETVEHVSDTGANRVPVAAEPDFVMSADLTGSGSGPGATDVTTDDL